MSRWCTLLVQKPVLGPGRGLERIFVKSAGKITRNRVSHSHLRDSHIPSSLSHTPGKIVFLVIGNFPTFNPVLLSRSPVAGREEWSGERI